MQSFDKDHSVPTMGQERLTCLRRKQCGRHNIHSVPAAACTMQCQGGEIPGKKGSRAPEWKREDGNP